MENFNLCNKEVSQGQAQDDPFIPAYNKCFFLKKQPLQQVISKYNKSFPPT